jgi:ATP-dependent Lhr-like helicase
MVAKAHAGRHALLIAPTGGGKTLAGFLPSLVELHERGPVENAGVHTLYISPLKALAVDVQRNLETPAREMGLAVSIESRTGDTSVAKRQRQRQSPPDILLTTPEQLALFCAWDGAREYFKDLRCVVIDEAHALQPSKRGDLLALGIARLQSFAPAMRRVGCRPRSMIPPCSGAGWGRRSTSCGESPARPPRSTCCWPRSACPGRASPPSTPCRRSMPRSKRPGRR